MAKFVVTAVGDDRSGLVAALASAAADAGGNWLEPRMGRLAGKFAGIVLVDAADASPQGYSCRTKEVGHSQEREQPRPDIRGVVGVALVLFALFGSAGNMVLWVVALVIGAVRVAIADGGLDADGTTQRRGSMVGRRAECRREPPRSAVAQGALEQRGLPLACRSLLRRGLRQAQPSIGQGCLRPTRPRR